MYRCYHLKSKVSKKMSQFLLRCYTTNAGSTLILLLFVTVAYDWRTGNSKYTILANDHCSLFDHSTYNTLFFSNFVFTTNKILQVIMFSAYPVYYYKFNTIVSAAQVSLQYSRELFKVAIAMGATIGISYFIVTVASILSNPEYIDMAFTSSTILLFIQQVVIMINSKKICALCKSYFSSD